jgi:broad specificity phosphatase PhoE
VWQRNIGTMPVTIHLVRHAQGIHNLSRELEGTHDPPLTDLGRQQCAELKARFPYHESITRLYASPMRRTLDTCLLSFDSNKYKTKTGHGVVAMHEMQEVSEFPCDTGSEVSTLEEEFGSVVDLSRVPANWNKKSKSPSWESKLVALETRAREARLALRELLKDAKPDEHVVVVTHGAFLHFLTNDYYNIAKTRGMPITPIRTPFNFSAN